MCEDVCVDCLVGMVLYVYVLACLSMCACISVFTYVNSKLAITWHMTAAVIVETEEGQQILHVWTFLTQNTCHLQDKLYVCVRQMTGIKIYIPSTQLLAGTEVRVY